MLCFPEQQATDDGKVTDIPAEIWEALVSVGLMAAKKTFLSSCQLDWCVQLTFLLHILLYKDNVQWLVWY